MIISMIISDFIFALMMELTIIRIRAKEYFSECPNRECQNGTIGSAKMTPSYNNISNIENSNTEDDTVTSNEDLRERLKTL